AHRGSEGSGKAKWIVIGSIALLAAGFGVFALVGKSKTKRNEARIVQLIGSETPTGTAADVALAVAFLDDPKAPPALKTQSSEVLERLEGSGISEAIHAQLKAAKNVPLKLRLSKVLAERNYAPAVAEMVQTFSSATTDDQRLQVLQSIRAIAGRADIDTMLGALNREHSLPVRKMLEDTVLAVLRRGGNNDAIVDKILAKISSSSGSERQSLFRILGVLGGEKVKTRLSETYATGDLAYQRDALKAYLNWPDRSVLPELEGIISTAGDDVLRISAEHAYVRLATLPGPEPIEQLVPLWQKAFQLASKPVDVRDLISSLLEYPAPETLAVLKEWEKNPTHGDKAKDAANTLAKSMQGIVELKPGDEIKGNRARVRGDRSASINGALSSLTGWVSPETYFSWSFKVAESGEYHVEVDQASLRDEPSDFVAYLAGKTLEGKSERTQDLEKFTTVRLDGSVQLEAGKIYLLTIAPGTKIQPRMMDIGAIRLVK
ncbi:MAG TPA: hypothetical protein PLA50_03270, partial [Bacteroidia bacterium]|nr:hypothetical protein [Bacteroidia bacterium]